MKIFIAFVLATFTLLAGEVDPKTFKKMKVFSAPHIAVIKAYDHGTVYELNLEVQTNRGNQYTTAYVTKDKKIVAFGEVLDANTGEAIKRPIDMKAVRENADIVYGKGSKEYVVFTDPECPYCVKFELMWPSIEKDVKLYVFFMPLSHHYNATKMSYYVMQQKTQVAKAKVLLGMANGDKSYERLSMSQQISDLFAQKMKDNQALANQFGVRGTPAVFDTKGAAVGWMSLGK